jgi:hypothetical protein
MPRFDEATARWVFMHELKRSCGSTSWAATALVISAREMARQVIFMAGL